MMGPLNDITAQASNKVKRQMDAPAGYQHLQSPAEKENLGKSKSPHFMTPTFSSTQSFAAPDTKNPRATTSVSVKATKNSDGNTFLRSAAKRVGLRRMADGPPHSSKEGMKGLSFPDKVCRLLQCHGYVLILCPACYTIPCPFTRVSSIFGEEEQEQLTAVQTSPKSAHRTARYE